MKEAKKWMVVEYEENYEKIVNSKLETIIKDPNIKDEDKVYMYNNELKKGFNQVPTQESMNSRKIDFSLNKIEDEKPHVVEQLNLWINKEKIKFHYYKILLEK